MKYLKDLDDELFEMSNFGTKTTGLPVIVSVHQKRGQHGPRIKVFRSYNPKVIEGDTFSISISEDPEIVAGDQGDITNKDVENVKDWIRINKESLLKYWSGEIITDDLTDGEFKLKKSIKL